MAKLHILEWDGNITPIKDEETLQKRLEENDFIFLIGQEPHQKDEIIFPYLVDQVVPDLIFHDQEFFMESTVRDEYIPLFLKELNNYVDDSNYPQVAVNEFGFYSFN